MFALLSKLLLLAVLCKSATDDDSGPSSGLDISLTSASVKQISNYTLNFDGSGIRDHISDNSVVEIKFSDAFLVWLRPHVVLQDSDNSKMLAEVAIVDNQVTFSAKLLTFSNRNVSFTLLDVVNPAVLSPVAGLELTIKTDDRQILKLKSRELKFSNKLGRVTVTNRHTQFIPGFYTSAFHVRTDTYVAYKMTLKIITDQRFMTAEPSSIDLVYDRLLFDNNEIQPAEAPNHSFRLAIRRDTPPSKYSVKFQLTEDNDANNFLPVEVVEFTVGFPDNSYSAVAPKPFNGPIPELRFNQRIYFAPLGGHSALKWVHIEPPATEDFQVEIKSILPTQPDKVMVHPNRLVVRAGHSKADFYLEPLVGSVSGSLHIQVNDLYYRTHSVVKEKRASLDVIYNEVESDHARIFVDERPLHAVSLLPLSLETVNATIVKGQALALNVETSLRLVLEHQGMAIFFFVKNMSQLLVDNLYHRKLRDLSPFLNNTLIDLEDGTAAFCIFPVHKGTLRGYEVTLDTTRREFLPYLDYKMFVVFRDGSGHLHLVDRYFSKTVSSNLKVFRIRLSAPNWMASKDVFSYVSAFTGMRHSLVPSGHSTDQTDERRVHSFLHLTSHEPEKVSQQLTMGLVSDRNLPLAKYYIYKEKGIVIKQEEWLRLEDISEVEIESLELSVAIEDIATNMLKYSLELKPHELTDFRGLLDFTAILKLTKKPNNYYEEDFESNAEESTSLAVFNKESLILEHVFSGLETGSEYALSARPCLFFKHLAVCGSKMVDLADQIRAESVATQSPMYLVNGAWLAANVYTLVGLFTATTMTL